MVEDISVLTHTGGIFVPCFFKDQDPCKPLNAVPSPSATCWRPWIPFPPEGVKKARNKLAVQGHGIRHWNEDCKLSALLFYLILYLIWHTSTPSSTTMPFTPHCGEKIRKAFRRRERHMMPWHYASSRASMRNRCCLHDPMSKLLESP